MAGERLETAQIERVMAGWSEPSRRLGRAARALVLGIAPGLDERIAFGSLSFVKPGAPYGVIGGNVCQVTEKDGILRLAFLHGASLGDPEGLLRGRAKAKRYVEIRTPDDLRRPAISSLVRAALEHEPA
ncbi:MAG: DUF1801 domain-containing protein [Planctomycetota bacterium]|jgi:hypothetical protein